MFRRFAAGSAVASVLIAIAALVVFVARLGSQERIYPVTLVWCAAPLVWGLWAMATPKAWLPQRLPLWGAILGLVAGLLGALVLNVPSRLMGVELSVAWRGLVVLVLVGFYYVLWMAVRAAYRALSAAA